MSALIHESDFEALAWSYFSQAAVDGVAHAEVFFDPQAHTSRGVAYNTVLNGFHAACQRAEKELDITTMLTTCFLRHLPPQDCLDMFEDADVQQSYLDGKVKGIGLDSSEKDFPPENFQELYFRAQKLGLNLTSHAGEEGPASYIASALHNLNVSRIDHGIALSTDPELMRDIVKKKIMLTVCPMSNVVLRCVDRIDQVPIRKFLDEGVRFSLNSDDPAYFGGFLLENYCRVHEAFNLSVVEWERIVRAGIEGSWCSDGRKSELLQRLEKVVKEWQGQLS
ncbi:adenosine deaminase [Corynespora cassiicola Philippines]|uniref:Adenine deaminase n=1 Tax=Corynespora cassiicola Philippines TaxID=1448308 RepID=A0A2T2P9E9_CORCC|nr:adenosine deaminase [Corynespora cassiicola Philippines]